MRNETRDSHQPCLLVYSSLGKRVEHMGTNKRASTSPVTNVRTSPSSISHALSNSPQSPRSTFQCPDAAGTLFRIAKVDEGGKSNISVCLSLSVVCIGTVRYGTSLVTFSSVASRFIAPKEHKRTIWSDASDIKISKSTSSLLYPVSCIHLHVGLRRTTQKEFGKLIDLKPIIRKAYLYTVHRENIWKIERLNRSEALDRKGESIPLQLQLYLLLVYWLALDSRTTR